MVRGRILKPTVEEVSDKKDIKPSKKGKKQVLVEDNLSESRNNGGKNRRGLQNQTAIDEDQDKENIEKKKGKSKKGEDHVRSRSQVKNAKVEEEVVDEQENVVEKPNRRKGRIDTEVDEEVDKPKSNSGKKPKRGKKVNAEEIEEVDDKPPVNQRKGRSNTNEEVMEKSQQGRRRKEKANAGESEEVPAEEPQLDVDERGDKEVAKKPQRRGRRKKSIVEEQDVPEELPTKQKQGEPQRGGRRLKAVVEVQEVLEEPKTKQKQVEPQRGGRRKKSIVEEQDVAEELPTEQKHVQPQRGGRRKKLIVEEQEVAEELLTEQKHVQPQRGGRRKKLVEEQEVSEEPLTRQKQGESQHGGRHMKSVAEEQEFAEELPTKQKQVQPQRGGRRKKSIVEEQEITEELPTRQKPGEPQRGGRRIKAEVEEQEAAKELASKQKHVEPQRGGRRKKSIVEEQEVTEELITKQKIMEKSKRGGKIKEKVTCEEEIEVTKQVKSNSVRGKKTPEGVKEQKSNISKMEEGREAEGSQKSSRKQKHLAVEDLTDDYIILDGNLNIRGCARRRSDRLEEMALNQELSETLGDDSNDRKRLYPSYNFEIEVGPAAKKKGRPSKSKGLLASDIPIKKGGKKGTSPNENSVLVSYADVNNETYIVESNEEPSVHVSVSASSTPSLSRRRRSTFSSGSPIPFNNNPKILLSDISSNITFFVDENKPLFTFGAANHAAKKKGVPKKNSVSAPKEIKFVNEDKSVLKTPTNKVPSHLPVRKKSTPHPSKMNVTFSAKKMPNFKEIHQRQFDKMESLKDYSMRKAERAKGLLFSPLSKSLAEPSRTKRSGIPVFTSTAKRQLPSVNHMISNYKSHNVNTTMIMDKKAEIIKGVRANKRFLLQMHNRKLAINSPGK